MSDDVSQATKKTYPLEVEGKIHPNLGPTMAGLNLLTGPNETCL